MVRLLLRLFFRELEVAGVRNVPEDRGVVVVSWHPNGLVDPALLLARLPRPLVFGARHGLFEVPLLGAVLRGLGTVPIFRAVDLESMDVERRRAANRRSVDALAARVAAGAISALFPEGDSHDAPHLKELKTGAARLYYCARALRPRGVEPPVILPVGLHYDKKKAFRSRALVWFHPPLRLPEELDRDPDPSESAERSRERARRLTGEIERELRDVIHATEDWHTHGLLHRVRTLIRAERAARDDETTDRPGVGEATVAFARVRAAYYRARRTNAVEVNRLRARIDRYDRDLRALGLADHELDRGPRLASPRLALLLVAHWIVMFVVAPPLLLFGYLVNWPAALAVRVFANSRASLVKDMASLKIVAGVIAYPLTWIATAWIVGAAHARGRILFPDLPGTALAAGLSAAALAMAGGWIAVRYVELFREAGRSLRVRLTRARSRAELARLLAERAALYEALIALAPTPDTVG